ncbi:MAG: DUF2062 domain-containing protein [Desulfuromonadaceae bacterium]
MHLVIVELTTIEATVISIDKIKQQFKKILSLDAHPGHIAAGFAVGVFVSFTPFFGLHTPLAIALAFIFRLNKLTCITGAWVNSPLTVVPALMASYNLGRLLQGKPVRELAFKSLDWHSIQPYAKSILLGSSILGFVAAVAAYFICYWLVIFFRRKDAALSEITREMEEVGEELD